MTDEGFDQQGASLNVAYELNDAMTIKYIFGYGDFDYTYTLDTDYSNSEISNSGNRVLEDVWNASHELQLLWDVSDNFFLTSGLYYFASDRKQDWTISHYNSQGESIRRPIMAALQVSWPHSVCLITPRLLMHRWVFKPLGCGLATLMAMLTTHQHQLC